MATHLAVQVARLLLRTILLRQSATLGHSAPTYFPDDLVLSDLVNMTQWTRYRVLPMCGRRDLLNPPSVHYRCAFSCSPLSFLYQINECIMASDHCDNPEMRGGKTRPTPFSFLFCGSTIGGGIPQRRISNDRLGAVESRSRGRSNSRPQGADAAAATAGHVTGE